MICTEAGQKSPRLSVANLLNDLSPIAHKWREFATKLGIIADNIPKFTKDDTNEACLEATVELYFTINSHNLADITDSLKNMEEYEVANYLSRKYK